MKKVKKVLVPRDRVVVAFVGDKTITDERAISALLGISRLRMDIQHYSSMSTMFEGAKGLALEANKIDLLVYLSDSPMSLLNSLVLCEKAGARAMLYFFRKAIEQVSDIRENIATLRLCKETKPAFLRQHFVDATVRGHWPTELINVR